MKIEDMKNVKDLISTRESLLRSRLYIDGKMDVYGTLPSGGAFITSFKAERGILKLSEQAQTDIRLILNREMVAALRHNGAELARLGVETPEIEDDAADALDGARVAGMTAAKALTEAIKWLNLTYDQRFASLSDSDRDRITDARAYLQAMLDLRGREDLQRCGDADANEPIDLRNGSEVLPPVDGRLTTLIDSCING